MVVCESAEMKKKREKMVAQPIISKMVPTLKKRDEMKITVKIVVTILLCSGASKVTTLHQTRQTTPKKKKKKGGLTS